MKIGFVLLGILLVLLQVRLWTGDGSLRQVKTLRAQLEAEEKTLLCLKTRNAFLEAEIADLKDRFDALEEHARSHLGMIRSGETFYQYLLPPMPVSEQGEAH